MRKIYDSPHQGYTINNWKKYGIKSDNYKELYYYHMSIKNCQLCNILFDDTIKNQRCLDHDHKTGLYRKTLCRSCNANYEKASQKLKCNNTSGFMWIQKNKYGYRYERKINGFLKRKQFKSLTKCIALSFINLLKYPLTD